MGISPGGWPLPPLAVLLQVIFHWTIKRSSTYYLILIILPSLILTTLTVLAMFWSKINDFTYLKKVLPLYFIITISSWPSASRPSFPRQCCSRSPLRTCPRRLICRPSVGVSPFHNILPFSRLYPLEPNSLNSEYHLCLGHFQILPLP